MESWRDWEESLTEQASLQPAPSFTHSSSELWGYGHLVLGKELDSKHQPLDST